jgi:hypothetical protein
MSPRKTVTGTFSHDGYEVFLDGQPVYAAGNNPHDSVALADPGHELSLARIAEFCERSAREIAAEAGAVFGGIEEEDNTRSSGLTPDMSAAGKDHVTS